MRRLCAIAVLVLSAHAAPASARSSEEYAYGYDQLWRTAVRLVAVDFRFPIVERDPDIGYLLFAYRDQGRSYDGSLELVRTRDREGAERVRVVVQVAAMPSYVERHILERLRQKLMEEHGPPRPPRRAPPAPPPGADEGESEPEPRS
ncbi:MAG TPA: hypothetical protein VIL20_28675 [Sandaracinaceae bacterium]